MGKFSRKLSGAFKKAVGASSSRSLRSSSVRYTEPKENPMHEDEETKPTVVQEDQEQEQPMEEGDNDPHLDLEGEWEMQAYNLIMNREFVHTPAYHPDLLQKIGMDIEFATIWKAVGWENVASVDEQALLNFDPVSMPEKCCNRPKIVAIAEIATLFSLGGIAGACMGKALDNAFLLSVAKCVLDLQHLGVAT